MAKDATNHSTATQRATSEPPDRPTGPLAVPVSQTDRDVVKVNNSNVTELKNACDDAVKRVRRLLPPLILALLNSLLWRTQYLGRAELFTQIHLHTDVRLGLGWLSVFVAGGTALYGYKVDFEKSKPVVWFGVIMYFLLTSIQTLYAYFVEGDTVFVGRRKTFSKRIITERITLSSKTQPARKTKASSANNNTTSTPPAYTLSISYVRSTNGGKSLLAKGKTKVEKGYTAFFDEQGTMDQEAFEKWVGEAVESAMDAPRPSNPNCVKSKTLFPTASQGLDMASVDSPAQGIARCCNILVRNSKPLAKVIAQKSQELEATAEKALQLAGVEPQERADRIAKLLENIRDRTERWVEVSQPKLLVSISAGKKADINLEMEGFVIELDRAIEIFMLEAEITGECNRRRASNIRRQFLKVLTLNRSGFTSKHFDGLKEEELQALSDFANSTLHETFINTDPDLRTNGTLSMLCKLASSAGVYPRAHLLSGVTCDENEDDPIGEGGFSTVYKGRYQGEAVCVKVLRLSQDTLNSYYKELTVWAHLNHPNILRFYGVCRSVNSAGRLVKLSLVSPWMKNGNLSTFAITLNPPDRLILIYDVIVGLAFLHKLGIVHGDLKGNNILVSNERRALITDFGASHITPKEAMKAGATSSQIDYTTRWAAPEILSGEAARPEMSCDIWSFGCLCGETLSGLRPFHHLPDRKVLFGIVVGNEAPFNQSTLYSNGCDRLTIPWIWDMISRCCAYSTSERPAANEIEKLMEGKANVQGHQFPGKTESASPVVGGLQASGDRIEPGISGKSPETRKLLRTHFNKASPLLIDNRSYKVQSNILTIEPSSAWLTASSSHDSYGEENEIPPDDNLKHLLQQYNALVQFDDVKPVKLASLSKFKKPKTLKKGPFADTIKAKYGDTFLAVRYIHSNNLLLPHLTELMQQNVLSHPNLLPFYGVFTIETSKRLALLTPWIEKGNISDYSENQDLQTQDKLRLLIGLASGLRYLHKHGIYHGALKPENVLVSDSGTALISDVCIGRIAIKASEADVDDNGEIGLARWRPRELSVLPREDSPSIPFCSAKGDILTGCHPYRQCQNDREVFAAHRREVSPAQNLARPPDIDKRVWALMLRCWYAAPESRPTMQEIFVELSGLFSIETTPQPPGWITYPDVKTFQREACAMEFDLRIVVNVVSSLRGNLAIAGARLE
ncbi:hypothetical protein NP233_g12371 [Leucocoprinus birnbaumii]|uniref:Signal peptidase complex subunit 2 n=1 Tax=Leucocoprinus birnbaumii TaxID=56174 RepID=A0AAD5YQ35_9AGAR|nr:hypothetical protein NP233_g12371 [Leucocoprinus birnbaumii]